MRTFSKKTQYCLRALYRLARSHGQGPILISDIAEQEAIPKKFLEAILLELKNKGVVLSKKGKGGGYLLGAHPAEITLGDVIRKIEGPLAPLPCASITAYRKCDECRDDHICGTRLIMREVRDATAAILDRTTLADVIRRIDDSQRESSNGHSVNFEI